MKLANGYGSITKLKGNRRKPFLVRITTGKDTTHEARHTCITQLTVHNVNPSVIKEIVGHKAAQSFTERVYTHIYLKTKIDAVNKIHTKIED